MIFHFIPLVLMLIVSPKVDYDQRRQNQNKNSDRIFESIAGDWMGEGKLFGNEAAFSMNWDQALGETFWKLEFHNALVRNGKQDTLINAVAYYHCIAGDSIIGSWIDDRPMLLPLRGFVRDSSLVIHWGAESTERGKTIYTLVGRNQISVVDSVYSGGNWRGFGIAKYKRL